MHKQGSHVGVVASFSVFILFLVGLYFIAQPVLQTGENKEVLVDSITEKILANMTIPLTTVFVVPETTSCLVLSFSDIGVSAQSVFVADTQGTQIPSLLQGGNIFIAGSSGELLTLYLANVSFASETASVSSCSSPRIASVRTRDSFFEETLSQFVTDFAAFRSSLSLSPATNVQVKFLLQDGTILEPENAATPTANVFSKATTLTYWTAEGGLEQGSLVVQVW